MLHSCTLQESTGVCGLHTQHRRAKSLRTAWGHSSGIEVYDAEERIVVAGAAESAHDVVVARPVSRAQWLFRCLHDFRFIACQFDWLSVLIII